jgi:hypothetical protein
MMLLSLRLKPQPPRRYNDLTLNHLLSCVALAYHLSESCQLYFFIHHSWLSLVLPSLDHPSRAEHGKFGGGQAQLTRIDLDVVFSQTRRSPTAGSGIAAMR